MRIFVLLLSAFLTFSGLLYTQESKTVRTTLHDFMDEYSKRALKNASNGNPEYVEAILKIVPQYSIADYGTKWQEISDNAMKTKEYKQACKSCHKEFKKEYKRAYRKRPIQVPQELIDLLEKMEK